MGCLQAQEEPQEEADRKQPLLHPASRSKEDNKNVSVVESTSIPKYTTNINEDEKQQIKHVAEHIAPDIDTEEKQASVVQKVGVIPGQCLIQQTFELQKDLSTLQQRYPQKYKPLIERQIKSINLKIQNMEKNSFKIMQFNMLADGLSTSYLRATTEKTFLNVDKECLQWTHRGLRLIEEMHRYSADIICIEECDQLPFLMEYMSRNGYKSYFQQKTKSPMRHIRAEILKERGLNADDSTSIQMSNDGVAILYKTATFEVAGDDENAVQYFDMKKNKESVMALAVALRLKSMNKEILFVVTHLKSTKTEQGEQLRERQINLLMKELIENEKNLPIILCCDLNANPVENKKGYNPLCYNSIVDDDNLAFKSVYKLANGTEPEYTTFKARKHGIDKHVLDYIFIREDAWNVTQILEIPTISDDELIPNWHYPSDHFSIMAQLTWTEDEKTEVILPGKCLIEASFNLDKDLESLRTKYEAKFQALLPRKMVDVACENIDDTYDIASNSVSVMQFNMLADGLTCAYSKIESEKSFLNVDKECLQWTHRGIRVVEEIARHNADIIALQECDQLPFIMKYLADRGYESRFQVKETSPNKKVAASLSQEMKMEIEMELDGVALIYKSDKFEICGDVQQITSSNKEKVFGLAVPLKVASVDQKVLFVVTHLKSTKTEQGEQLRERQINLLMKELIQNDENLPLILCCDLNANPVQNKKGYNPLCYNSIVDDDNLAFKSVYKLANGTEPEYTTFKARKHGVDKHVLDYIFIKGGQWNVTKILQIPQLSEDNLIPNWFYPSDHFSIMTQLTWK